MKKMQEGAFLPDDELLIFFQDGDFKKPEHTVSRGLRENRTQEGTHRFYRFPHAAARPHAPFLSGGAVSIDQM